MSEHKLDFPAQTTETSPNTYPTKLTRGTILLGLINAATWPYPPTGEIFILGREMLGRGNGVPDPSNSVLLRCDRYGNVLNNMVVARPNEQGEQFEDWRADTTDHGTVILGATWTAKMEGLYRAQMAWTEVPANWDGRFRMIHKVPEAGYGKNVTPWYGGRKILFRRDDSVHTFDDYLITGNGLKHIGEVHMPQAVKGRFIRSGTTYAPELNRYGTGFGFFHFQEEIEGELVYSIREASFHTNGGLVIDNVDLERAVTKDSFRDLDLAELRQGLPTKVVYMTGKGLYNVADRATYVASLPGLLT